jgi:N-acetylmuramoyl-L-alanine amidase/putative methionine-R-sulfoxide reductase with GAF domain
MATVTPNPSLEENPSFGGPGVPSWPRGQNSTALTDSDQPGDGDPSQGPSSDRRSRHDALQALLAFSALHEQVRRRKALGARRHGFDLGSRPPEFDADERFVLDEVLQLVAERAVAITGADGLAIALAENDEIVLRAAAGIVRPDVGARIDRDSAFSGASFRTAQIVNCDDTETDARVNLQACRRLGARSMVAVPLCGRRRVIGLLEAFSAWPFGFNESDVRNLSLLAELVVGALKPEDEDRFAQSAQTAATKLEPKPRPTQNSPASPVPAVPALEPAAVQAFEPAAVPPVLPLRKPVAPKSISEPASHIPSEPVTPVEKPVAIEAPAARVNKETAAAPESIAGQEKPARTRPGILIVLIAIAVAASFALGLFLKLRTSPSANATITSPKQPSASNAAAQRPVVSPARSASSTAAPASSDTTATNSEWNTPATPQELAKFPRVSGIRHWSSADSSTVVLDLEDQVQYEAHRLAQPDRIYFDLHDTQLAPELAGKTIDIGDALLSRVRIAQPVAGMTRVVLETKGNSNFSVSLEPNPYRLVVEIRKIGAPAGAVNLFPNAEAEKNRLAIVVPPPSKEDLQLKARVPKLRIVVDAGHGGWDLGTVGRRGLLEKDLVLEIAQRLGKLLESRLGADVIYTRQDDNYIPLDERAAIANQAQADLFISVHANYSDLPSARGVETYFTNSFSAPGSKDAGARDIDSHANNAKSPVGPTLSPADLHERIEQSRRLAASVQRSLYGALSVENPGLRDRGIKEANFVVLTESAMPGILAEVSFVSSPTDEQKLRSDGYREHIAEALYRGIARYAASSKGVKVASAVK